MSDSQIHHIAAATHGRYCTRTPSGAGPFPLLIGFHGYGETADIHLERLASIPNTAEWLLCSVQGLHLFYGRQREVVASWMTRLDRDLSIQDNISYVNKVIARLRHEHAASDKLVYAGFSQGASMAYRAALLSEERCSGLIALGGDLPPELKQLPPIENHLPVLICRGQQNQFFSHETMEHDSAALHSMGALVETHTFNGEHQWSESSAKRCDNFLRKIISP